MEQVIRVVKLNKKVEFNGDIRISFLVFVFKMLFLKIPHKIQNIIQRLFIKNN